MVVSTAGGVGEGGAASRAGRGRSTPGTRLRVISSRGSGVILGFYHELIRIPTLSQGVDGDLPILQMIKQRFEEA